jgi:hypothetical protein
MKKKGIFQRKRLAAFLPALLTLAESSLVSPYTRCGSSKLIGIE